MPAADWYVDPLGRFEGRYFDGERWTARVKDHGRLAVDPDWDRPESADVPTRENPVAPSSSTTTDRADDLSVTADRDATEPIRAVSGRGFVEESPVRRVAVLDETATETSVAPEPVSTTDRRWMYAVAAALAVGLVLILLLPRQFGGDDSASSDVAAPDETDAGIGLPATDTNDTADVADGISGGDGAPFAPADQSQGDTGDAAAPPITGDPSEDPAQPAAPDEPQDDAMQVGDTTILNGRRMLIDLEIWHASSVIGRSIELGPDAGCWFGAIGPEVVQNAYCGPVATTPGAEPRFDLIPLRFEDVSDNVIQARPVTDSVVTDEVVGSTATLVGRDGPVDLATLAGE